MIKQIRKKFIAVAMCSIFLVIGFIIACINIINFHEVKVNADIRIDLITHNGGKIPTPDEEHKPLTHKDEKISPEAPFDTRYFTVEFAESGEIAEVDTEKIAAISDKAAESYAYQLFEKNKTSGFVENYRYKAVQNEQSTLYVFVDCERELSTFYSFLFASIVISFLGILTVFILLLFLSKLIVKTAAKNIEKQKRFITDASHEIKTPLTIIDANTEIIEMEHGENEWTQSTRKQIRRLTELTNKLVTLSRLDEDENILIKETFSLSELVKETADEFSAIALAKGKTFTSEIKENINFSGDKKAFIQLVYQLFDNAVKYSDEGGKIHISLAKSGKSSILTIYNTADKIEKGNHDIFFERFYRADSSRNSENGGHGIGLSVAKAIVNSHKGKISAKSTDGRSLTITVVI